MSTSKREIESWVRKAKSNEKNTHLIVVCDTFDWEDYPVEVKEGEDIRDVIKKYNGSNMQKIMEVYSMKMDIDAQLKERPSWHPDHE